MIPYADDDLAALALHRKLVSLEQLREAAQSVPQDQRRPGWLIQALGREMLLGDVEAQDLIRRLQHCAVHCPACDQRFAVLLAPVPRDVPCPACGAAKQYPAEARGIRPLRAGWELGGSSRGSSRGGSPLGQTRPDSRLGSSWASDATVRGPGQGDDSKLRHSQGDSSEPAARFAPRVRLESSDQNPSGSRGLTSPGARVANYVIEREISRGSMGVVLAARHAEIPDRRVAVKVMRDRYADAEGLERFQREGEALARIDHPNVVRVHEAGRTEDDRAYLVMDYVEGRDLERLLSDEGALDVGRAATLMAGVARGVAHINALGVVHRDLKLANVLVDEQDRPVIADFGLVYLVDRATRLTMEGDRLGTPLYMAPEAIRGDLDVDQRVDVYSLGVMFYRLLSRKYPYHADSFTDLCDQVLHAPLGMPQGSRLSRDARAVIEHALARNRDERYANASALAEDLEALAQGVAVEARPIGRARKLVRQRPWLAVVAALALVLPVLAAAGAAAARNWTRGQLEHTLRGLTQRLEEQRAELAELTALEPAPPRDDLLRQADASLTEGDQHHLDTRLLRAARDALVRVAARRQAVARVQRARQEGKQRALREALPGLLELPLPDDPAPIGCGEFLAELGWLQIEAGQLEAGLETLGRVPAPQAWSGPRARAAELRAWAHAYRGAFTEAADALSTAPAEVRRAVWLAQVESASSIERAQAPLGRLGELADAPGLAWRVQVATRRLRGEPPQRTQLPALRALGDPQPWSLLCEGRAALALGWYDTAARAFAKARESLDPLPYPGFALPLWEGAAPTLLPPRLAARLGEARARALSLDGADALEACDLARAWAGWSTQVSGAIALAESQAHELNGEESQADAALTLAERALGATDTVGRWRARRRALREGQAGQDPEGASRLEAIGAAELAAAEAGAEAPLRRARRALRAALTLDGDRPEACSLLAQVALLEQDVPKARAWLDRARGLATDHWRVAWAEGLIAARAGRIVEAVTAFDFARQARAEGLSTARDFAREAALLSLDLHAASALEAAQAPSHSLEALWRAAQRAQALPAPPPTVAALLNDCHRRALDLKLGPLVDEIRAAQDEAARWTRDINALAERAGPGNPQAYQELVEAAPTVSYLYVFSFSGDANGMGEEADRVLSGQAFDRLVLATELRPCEGLASGLRQRVSFERSEDQGGVGFMRTRLRGLIHLDSQDTRLPFPRDLPLRRALAAVFTLDINFDFEEADLEVGLEGAWDYLRRRPAEQAGSLLLGRLLVRAGDLAGAALHLERADRLAQPFQPRKPGDGILPKLYRAMAQALGHDWQPARETIQAARLEAEAAWKQRAISDAWHIQLGTWIQLEHAFWESDGRTHPEILQEAQLLAQTGHRPR